MPKEFFQWPYLVQKTLVYKPKQKKYGLATPRYRLAQGYMPAHQHCDLFYPLGWGSDWVYHKLGNVPVLRSGTGSWGPKWLIGCSPSA